MHPAEGSASCKRGPSPPTRGSRAEQPPALEPCRGLQEAALGRAPGKRGLRGGSLDSSSWPVAGRSALPFTPSLCGVPAAIVSGRGMEDLAVPQCHVQGLWGIQRQPAVFVGGLQHTASLGKARGCAFRNQIADPRRFPPPGVPARNLEIH